MVPAEYGCADRTIPGDGLVTSGQIEERTAACARPKDEDHDPRHRHDPCWAGNPLLRRAMQTHPAAENAGAGQKPIAIAPLLPDVGQRRGPWAALVRSASTT